MLFDAVIATFLAAAFWLLIIRLSKGRFPPALGKIELRSAELFIIAFSLQALFGLLSMKGIDWAKTIFPWVHIFSYILLIYAVLKNWHLYSIRIAGLGILLNFVVISANLGHMPADVELVRQTGGEDTAALVGTDYYPRQVPISKTTRFIFLGDVLALPHPYPRPCVFSIGDIFITIGACWLVLSVAGLLPDGKKIDPNYGPTKKTSD